MRPKIKHKIFQKLSVIDVIDVTKAKDVFIEGQFKHVHFIYKQCSVTDDKKLRDCMSLLKQEMNGLDIVINSVGILDEQSPLKTIEINYVRAHFETLMKYFSFSLTGRRCQLHFDRN